ncbi:unnamed protein product [Closterium sp. Yama58-4]|nr:unnamed protein product [Closterium sp. Yama58-4]
MSGRSIKRFTESGAAHAAVLPGRVGQGPLLAAVSDDDEDTIVSLFENATASVVSIMNVEMNGSGKGKGGAGEEVMEGIGSGFVWDEYGHIVTNYHVVAKLATDTSGRQACRVSLLGPTGAMQTYAATLVGTDPSRDLAVLKVDLSQPVPAAADTGAAADGAAAVAAPAAPTLYPIPVGSSSDLRVGQSCFAIGNPYGLQHTLTAGVISGLGREIPAPTGAAIRGAIQTDAAINAGNSGGPLLDSFGRIIGVNTATFTRSGSGSSSGVNFAIPVDTAAPAQVRVASSGLPSFARVSAENAATAIDPSATFANVMWSKTYNTQILVGESESTESVVRRFKKVCMEANIVNECRRRRFFETQQDIIKRKQKDAARQRKRFSRASSGPRPFFQRDPAAANKAAAAASDDDDDFWDAQVEL